MQHATVQYLSVPSSFTSSAHYIYLRSVPEQTYSAEMKKVALLTLLALLHLCTQGTIPHGFPKTTYLATPHERTSNT